MSSRAPTVLWLGWGLALVGGAALFAGLLLALGDPCVDAASATMAAECEGLSPLVVALTLGGTVVAVVGGTIATVAGLRRDRGGGR